MHYSIPLKFMMDPTPQGFKKWIDSIDQATRITGRDLRKELLKKSDGVIRNTLLDDG